MTTPLKKLRLGTRLLIITPVLGVEHFVFELPFDRFVLTVLLACIASVILEYKAIYWGLSRQPNNLARSQLSAKLNRFGYQALLAGLVFLVAAQYEKTPELVLESARVGGICYVTGLVILVSSVMGLKSYLAYQQEWTQLPK